MKNALVIILINAALLASGILVVLVACFTYDNFYPLLTILVNLLAILQLMMCGACASVDSLDMAFGDNDGCHGQLVGIQVSWLLFGLMASTSFAIPSLLWRAKVIPEVALYLTWTGGTTILAAMIIYMRAIYYQKSELDL